LLCGEAGEVEDITCLKSVEVDDCRVGERLSRAKQALSLPHDVGRETNDGIARARLRRGPCPQAAPVANGVDWCHVPRYTSGVIKTFADKRTKELYETGKSKRFPPNMWGRALRKLEYLDLATSDAWCLVDHQFSHVFIRDQQAEVIQRVRQLFADTNTTASGIAEVLVGADRAKGGLDEPENLQLAHAECNWRKGCDWRA